MKNLVKYLLLLVFSGIIISCGTKSEDSEKVLKEAKALDQKFVEAYNKGDIDGVMLFDNVLMNYK